MSDIKDILNKIQSSKGKQKFFFSYGTGKRTDSKGDGALAVANKKLKKEDVDKQCACKEFYEGTCWGKKDGSGIYFAGKNKKLSKMLLGKMMLTVKATAGRQYEFELPSQEEELAADKLGETVDSKTVTETVDVKKTENKPSENKPSESKTSEAENKQEKVEQVKDEKDGVLLRLKKLGPKLQLVLAQDARNLDKGDAVVLAREMFTELNGSIKNGNYTKASESLGKLEPLIANSWARFTPKSASPKNGSVAMDKTVSETIGADREEAPEPSLEKQKEAYAKVCKEQEVKLNDLLKKLLPKFSNKKQIEKLKKRIESTQTAVDEAKNEVEEAKKSLASAGLFEQEEIEEDLKQRQATLTDRQNDLLRLKTFLENSEKRGVMLKKKLDRALEVAKKAKDSDKADERRKALEGLEDVIELIQASLDSADWISGIKLENYKKGERLGKGAFGAVYRLGDGDEEGSKSLVMKVGTTSEALEEMEHEADVYESLGEHPNIARCLGVQEVDGEKGLVMEEIKGGNVNQLRKNMEKKLKQGKLKTSEFWGVMQYNLLSMVKGLQHMHEKGLVHQDLKPDNVMIDSATGDVKLVDMGLARVKGEDDERAGGGTGLFKPNERNKEMGADVDAYTVGSTAFNLGDQGSLQGEDLLGSNRIDKKHEKWMLSEYGKFMAALMDKDPNKRLTMEQALEHPFLKDRLLDDDQARETIKKVLTPAEESSESEEEEKEPVAEKKPSEKKSKPIDDKKQSTEKVVSDVDEDEEEEEEDDGSKKSMTNAGKTEVKKTPPPTVSDEDDDEEEEEEDDGLLKSMTNVGKPEVKKTPPPTVSDEDDDEEEEEEDDGLLKSMTNVKK